MLINRPEVQPRYAHIAAVLENTSMRVKDEDRRISLVAFDLDGTLIQEDGDVGFRTQEAIREVAKKGIYVTICTGRVPTLMKLYAQLANVNAPYVCANGALVLDPQGNILHDAPLSKIAFRELGAFCDWHRIPYIAQTAVNMQATRDNPRLYKYEKYRSVCRKYGCDLPTIREIDNHADVDENEIYKVIISAQNDCVRQMLRDFLQPNAELYTYTSSDTDLFDVTAPGADKGFGLKRIAQLTGVPMEHVCVFGDFDNDLSSFALAGTSVAMGNATNALKKQADYVTLSNEKNGIAHALKKLEPFLYPFEKTNLEHKGE